MGDSDAQLGLDIAGSQLPGWLRNGPVLGMLTLRVLNDVPTHEEFRVLVLPNSTISSLDQWAAECSFQTRSVSGPMV